MTNSYYLTYLKTKKLTIKVYFKIQINKELVKLKYQILI